MANTLNHKHFINELLMYSVITQSLHNILSQKRLMNLTKSKDLFSW